MAGFFLESSALVKRYVGEAGTGWVRTLTRSSETRRIYVARITAVEVTAAVARHRREKTVTPAKASSILFRLRKHFAGRYRVVEITNKH